MSAASGELPFEPPAETARRGSVLGSVNVVVATYAVDGALSFAVAVAIARALGTEGRGAYGLFTLSVAFATIALSLGIGPAAVYHLNKRAFALRELLAAVHLAVLWTLAISAAGAAVLVFIDRDPVGGDISPWLFVAAIPVTMYAVLLRLLLQAMSRFVEQGLAVILQALLMLALVLIAGADSLTPSWVVALWITSNTAGATFSLLRIGLREVDLARVVRPRLSTLSSLVRFGAQGEAGNVLQLLNYRLDAYLVSAFVGLAGVGIYGVGVSLQEAVWLVANAVAIVLLPRLTAAGDDEAAVLAPVAARNTLLVAAAGAIPLAAAAPVLVPLIFGDAFEGAVEALWLLLPGAVALSGSKVLTSYIFSQGRPLVNTAITAVSLVVTVAADLALIPAFGVNGAAAASSLAYVTHFGATLYAYARISGRPAIDAALPRFEDARLYADAARGLLGRFGRAPSEAGG